MPLEKQTITIPLGSMGMDAGKDPKINPGLLRAENAAYNLDGSISKRTGSSKVADLGTQYPIAAFRGSVVQLGAAAKFAGGEYLHGGNEASHIVDVGLSPIGTTNHDGYHIADVAQGASYTLVGYMRKSGADYYITFETFNNDTLTSVDTETQGPYVIPRCPRCVLLGTSLLGYWFNGSGALYKLSVNATTGAITNDGALGGTTAGSATKHEWDVCAISTTHVMLAYPSTTTNDVVVLSLPLGAAAGLATVSIANGNPAYLPAIWRQTDTSAGVAWVVSNGATDELRGAVYTTAGAATLASTLLDSLTIATWTRHAVTGVAKGNTDFAVYWSQHAALGGVPQVRRQTCTVAGVAGTAGLWIHRARLATKAMRCNQTSGATDNCVGVFSRSWGYSYGAQDSIFWLWEADYGAPSLCGKSLLGKARTSDTVGHLPAVQYLSSQVGITIGEWLTQLDNSADAKNVYQLGLLRIDFTTSMTALSATPVKVVASEAGTQRLLVPGSLPMDCDGNAIVELGFLQYPEPFAATGGGTAGGLTAGTYRYKLAYEWIDANGTKHQSSPSPEYNGITLTTETEVDLVVPTLTVTRRSGVQVAVYRTIVGGTSYYRAGTVANDPTAATVAYNDRKADADITHLEPLYTDSGVVENYQPHPTRLATMFQNRYCQVDRDNEATDIYYSKEFGASTPVDCSDTMLVQCDATGGAITALAPFLDKLIIFKANAVYATEGSGYDATLGGSNFARPYIISTGVGCTDPRCMAVIPAGLVFLGSDGDLHLLNSSLQVVPFSPPVDYWMNTLTPVALVVEPAQGLLHLFTTTYDLVYDWTAGKWAIWSGRDCARAISVDGVAHWIDADQVGGYYPLLKSDSTVWTDNAARQAMTLETGWIAPAQGAPVHLYRATIIGQNLASHTLRVKIGYDYDPHWVDSRLYNAAALATFGVSDYHGTGLSAAYLGQAYCLRVDPSRPTATAVRFSISDESGTGDTWSAAAIGLLIGVKGGGQRVQNARVK